MALAELIGKLRTKKQAAHRTSFQAYLATVKELAGGGEIDADECSHILSAADRSEDDLERDVGIQSQRLAWHAQLLQHKQATADRIQAERDFLAAQRKLQRAIDELSPAVRDAENRMRALEQVGLTTATAEARLSELILDQELLQREAAVIAQLREVSSELSPLLQDREHKRHSLENAEYNLSKLQARKEGDWVPAGIVQFFNQPADIRVLKERVADLKSQIQQLDIAIAPRQQQEAKLQAELSEIHRQKLEP